MSSSSSSLLSSWIYVPENSDFTIHNIPFGVFSPKNVVVVEEGESESSTSTRRPSSSRSSSCRCGTIIGNTVIDLSIFEEAGIFDDISNFYPNSFYHQTTLNTYLKYNNHTVWKAVRKRIQELLVLIPISISSSSLVGETRAKDDGNNNRDDIDIISVDDRLRTNIALQNVSFYHINDVTLHLPVDIRGYTDFYSSKQHAINVGTMFRSKENALNPNWLHLPVGYHGRSSTIFVSGTPIIRPKGQIQQQPITTSTDSNNNHKKKEEIVHEATKKLDFELEMAAVIGGDGSHDNNNSQTTTTPLSINDARQRIFGYLLMNDWSARDIQKFEYVPLGPFTSKNFATSISSWIITSDALEHYKVTIKQQQQDYDASNYDPVPLPYLQDPEYSTYDVRLSVSIRPSSSSISQIQQQPATAAEQLQHPPEETIVCKSNFKHLYWNSVQQLVHHSVSGCIMESGDLLGSGTISGNENENDDDGISTYGSMLEISWNGTKPIHLPLKATTTSDDHDHDIYYTKRTFLEDGDTVIIRGSCYDRSSGGSNKKIFGFGECIGTIIPSSAVETTITASTTTTRQMKKEEEEEVDNDDEKKNSSSPQQDKKEQHEEQDRYIDFKLYSYWRSSSSWRVRIVLEAKSIQYKYIPITTTSGSSGAGGSGGGGGDSATTSTEPGLTTSSSSSFDKDYLISEQKNSMGQVPTLEFYDTYTKQRITMSQSMAIIQFLEDIYPNRKCLLVPTNSNANDNITRAVMLEMVEIVNSAIQPLQNLNFLYDIQEQSNGLINAIDTARLVNERGLIALQTLIIKRRQFLQKEAKIIKKTTTITRLNSDNNNNNNITTDHNDHEGRTTKYYYYGPYCMGTFQPTIVDCYLVPQLYNARRYGVNVHNVCPILVDIVDNYCMKHIWFKKTKPEVQIDAPKQPKTTQTTN